MEVDAFLSLASRKSFWYYNVQIQAKDFCTMKLHKTTEIRGWGKLKPLLPLFAVAASVCVADAASPVYTIHAPNGIGDVITLTNVLATMETDGASVGLKLWLEPGVYDLRGIKMEMGSHLVVRHTRDSLIAAWARSRATPFSLVAVQPRNAVWRT